MTVTYNSRLIYSKGEFKPRTRDLEDCIDLGDLMCLECKDDLDFECQADLEDVIMEHVREKHQEWLEVGK